MLHELKKDLFNDGPIGDAINEESKVSLEPTVEPPAPKPVEFPIKRNNALDRFNPSGPSYSITSSGFPKCQMNASTRVACKRSFLFDVICIRK